MALCPALTLPGRHFLGVRLEQLLGQVHDAKPMVDLGKNEAGRSKDWRADIRQAGTL